MKKFSLLVSVFTILFFASCSDVEPLDPALNGGNTSNNGGGNNNGGSGGGNGSGGGSGSGSIVGTYLMTAFNSSVPVDIDFNGSSATNLMDETDCLDNNFLVLNANNSFTANSNGIDITFDGTNETIECFNDPNITGTWSLSGNTLSLTYTYDGDVYTDDYNVSGNNLVYTINDGEVVGTSSTGDPVYVTADINIIYTKQ